MPFENINNTSDSATALCPVFGECGGCEYQNITYDLELKTKQEAIKEILGNLIIDPIVSSPQEYYYRHRIDLKLIKTKQNEILIGFSPKDNRKLIPIETCYIARKELSKFIPELKSIVPEKLTEKYRQANLVVRTGDDGLIRWGGIGRRSLTLKPEDYLWTQIGESKIFYSLESFFQANLYILPKLFDQIKNFPIWNNNTIFLDLYGGVGLFSVALHGLYEYAYLIEDNKQSAQLADYNKSFHQFKDLTVIEGKVETYLSEIFQKHPNSPIVAMIDPPRAGLSQKALKLFTDKNDIKHLLYLSCHPESLKRDLTALTHSLWSIKKIIPFDFFPKTKHIETLVWLTQN